MGPPRRHKSNRWVESGAPAQECPTPRPRHGPATRGCPMRSAIQWGRPPVPPYLLLLPKHVGVEAHHGVAHVQAALQEQLPRDGARVVPVYDLRPELWAQDITGQELPRPGRLRGAIGTGQGRARCLQPRELRPDGARGTREEAGEVSGGEEGSGAGVAIYAEVKDLGCAVFLSWRPFRESESIVPVAALVAVPRPHGTVARPSVSLCTPAPDRPVGFTAEVRSDLLPPNFLFI